MFVEPLLRQFGAATAHSAPTRYELGLVHGMYLAGLAVIAGVGAGVVDPEYRLPPGTGLKIMGACTALVYLALVWVIRFRRVPPEKWFVSHLLWLTLTFSFALLAGFAAVLLILVGLLLVAAIRAAAGLLFYGPVLVAILVALWFAWRMVSGYLALWRRNPVGGW